MMELTMRMLHNLVEVTKVTSLEQQTAEMIVALNL